MLSEFPAGAVRTITAKNGQRHVGDARSTAPFDAVSMRQFFVGLVTAATQTNHAVEAIGIGRFERALRTETQETR